MAKERKLPEILEYDFIICDNTLNRKGWRLLVEGIDFNGFLKNPVCCVQHNTWVAPVGKWKNLRIENSQLLGTVEFDRNDDEAVRLYWKYTDGYMNACSLSIVPVSESDDPSMLVPGQRYSTITKSELLEVSLVTVPGQKNAVRLSTPEGEDYKLHIINNENPKKEMELEKENPNDELLKQLAAAYEKNVKNLVKLHHQRGVVHDGEVESLQKLALSDYDTVEKMLEARTPPANDPKKDEKPEKDEGKELSDQVRNFTQNSGGGTSMAMASERNSWSFYDYFRKDPAALSLMREKEPDKYKKLEADYAQWAEAHNLVTDPVTEQQLTINN